MKRSKITLFALVLFFAPVALLAQGHWVGSNNSTSPMSRTGLTTIGTPTYLHSSSVSRTQLTVDAGNISYGPLNATIGKVGFNSPYGNAVGYLGSAYYWSAHRGMRGVVGSATVTSISTSYANKDAVGLGGDFSANISNPIAFPGSPGDYYVGGVRAQLIGSISSYPANGAVSALIAIDRINGSGTYAGYFRGRGYFSENVGIGVLNPVNALEVCGTIRATEVKVEAGWCDYVFEKEYVNMPLEKVNAFIQKNGHLPNTPSAAEIQSNGLELSAATQNQQEKIEEVFLHLIEMNEKIKSLEAANLQLKSELSALKGGE